MPARMVTYVRPKRPPKKRKAAPLDGPRIIGDSDTRARALEPATWDSDNHKAAIVTARRPGARSFGAVPDMTPEEHRRRGDAAAELWYELVRRAASKDGP
jgi:hypothetical protein